MKARLAAWITALTVIVVLALPGRVAAQHQANPAYPYILIDLGTFGGPQADICCVPNGALTNSGLVAGTADTTMLDPYYPYDPASNGDPYVQHAFLWHRGVLTDMGALGAQPADNSSAPGGVDAINERGDIAGLSEMGITDTLTGYQQMHAVLWARGQMSDLGTLGGNESQAWSINDRDQVVGSAANAIPDALSMLAWGTQTRAFVWQNDVMRDLGTLGGPDAIAFLVNDRGQVAGTSYTDAITNPVTWQPTTHPFLWQSGHMQDLGTLGGAGTTFGATNSLNNRGEVVGGSDLPGDLTYHPYLWDGQALHDLGTLGGNYGVANWINDAGAVVGWATTAGDTTSHAFLWSNGVLGDLGVPPGDTYSVANAINRRGQIVGSAGNCGATSCTNGAFLWDHGAMYNLQSLAAPSDLQLTAAWDINDGGEIFGFGVFPNGQQHAVLMVPSGLAESEGITSNAPAPGTTGPATGAHSSRTNCVWGPAWRRRLAPRYYPPMC